MNAPLHSRVVTIRNPQGLHARPAELFVRTALKYKARIEVINDPQRVDAKSMLHLLTLGAKQGTRLRLEAEGDDAADAVETLAKLVESGFGEAEAEVAN
jgi:phosphotransferase system HPr (HPr) family protein